MIRAKLIVAFAVLSSMALSCGVVGLFFVDRLGKSLSLFSDVTSPLLTESLALVERAQRMRAAFLAAIDADAPADEVYARLSVLHAASRTQIGELYALVTERGIELPLDALTRAEQQFAVQLLGTLATYRREQDAVLETKERVVLLAARRRELRVLLQALVDRAEGRITKSEDEAKVSVQTGTATVDGLGALFSDLITEIYPVVQNAHRILQENDKLDDTLKALLLQSNIDDAARLASSMQSTLRTIDSLARRLRGRLRDVQGVAEMERIMEVLDSVETAALGQAGVLEGQREVLKAKSEVTTRRSGLDRAERLYLGSLEEMVQVVGTVNQRARADAAFGLARARYVIAGSVLVTLFGGMAFGIMFARRLTGPLSALANHANAIRETGKLTGLPGRSVSDRGDEIGELARSFDQMVAELANARRRLIDRSEAELRTQFERLDAALNNMSQGLIMMDKGGRVVVCNDRFLEMYGLSRNLVKPGCPLPKLPIHDAEDSGAPGGADYRDVAPAQMHSGKPTSWVSETEDGREISISDRPMSNGGWVSTHEDVTERRAAQAKIAHMAHHDALTGLPNRLYFSEQLASRFKHHEHDQQFAVVSFDLDRFKAVNDTLGHSFGDKLLRQVAERVRACLREEDILARLGGDEFVILQEGVTQPADTSALATRLNEVLGAPFDLDGHQVVIGVSIGIAVAPTDADSPDDLLKNADMALYRAKTDGRGTYRFFEPQMDALMQARRVLELDLRKALVTQEFELYYQPIIDLGTDEICGFEALLRWNHPTRGLVSPMDFVPLAEETELIVPIGEWVLATACKEAMKWPSHLRIAVNISPIQFKHRNIALMVASILGESFLDPKRLELEITESVLLYNSATTLTTLHQLRTLGVRISMDDFGTGFSSLSYLRSFPFDKIKIDRSFVHNLTTDPDSMAIIRAVTGLGSSLGMATTGEGVETQEELDYLRSQGCTEAQGYFFSRPRPASEIISLLGRPEVLLQARP